MSNSLRDQLLALGFSQPKPAPRRDERGKGPRPSGKGPSPSKPDGGAATAEAERRRQEEIDLARAYALRAQAERAEAERARREAEERAREKRERKLKLAALLEGKALNAADAEIARNFPHGGKIRRLYVTPDQLPRLNAGELGIVQHLGRYLLVPRELALAAQAIAPEALVLLPDPDAPAEDDVPPDLVW